MRIRVERYHWLNTIVGILDQAFHLTDEEQIQVIAHVNHLLTELNIPDRSEPSVIPPPLALEMSASFYTTQLSGPRESGLIRPIRRTTHQDMVVSVQAWDEMFLTMLTTAYPDMTPIERIYTSKQISTLLDAIGVPDRAAAFFPEDVVRVARNVDA